MQYQWKEKKVYHGVAIPFIIFIVFPIGMYFLFRFFISHYNSLPDFALNNMALGFAGLTSTIFGLGCLLSGIIYYQFVAMITRIKETIYYYGFGSKEGFKWYFGEFWRDGGIIMWLFFLVLAADVVITTIGFTNYFSWLNY